MFTIRLLKFYMTPLNLAMLDYFIIYLPVIYMYIAIPKAKNVWIQLSTSLLLMYVEDLVPSLNALIYLHTFTYLYYIRNLRYSDGM